MAKSANSSPDSDTASGPDSNAASSPDSNAASSPNSNTGKPLKIHWRLNTFLFIAFHLGCLAVFSVPFSWGLVALCFGLYLIRMFAITAGYHRYFSHRTFKTSRAFQFLLALVGTTALQKGPLWWAAHHRHHHRHSDEDPDHHSPSVKGFFQSHVGWIFRRETKATDMERIADFARFPELRWLDRHHEAAGITLGVALFLVGGLPAFVWGFVVSTVLTWHITFCINSLTHIFGKRRYATSDNSRNSLLLALLTLGEGWHNNHHHYKSCTRQGFFWWEIDVTYYGLRLLGFLGIVWDIKEPPKKVVETDRLDGNRGVSSLFRSTAPGTE